MATTLFDKNGNPVRVADARRVAGMLKDGFTAEPVAAPADTRTKAELQEVLYAAGIEFKQTDTKAALLELMPVAEPDFLDE